MQTLGELIKRRRLELGISQVRLARLLNYSGPYFISSVEADRYGFPRKKLKRLCRALLLDKTLVFSVVLNQERRNLLKDLGIKDF